METTQKVILNTLSNNGDYQITYGEYEDFLLGGNPWFTRESLDEMNCILARISNILRLSEYIPSAKDIIWNSTVSCSISNKIKQLQGINTNPSSVFIKNIERK